MPQKVRGTHRANLYRCPRCTLEFLDIWASESIVKSFYESEEVVYQSDIQQGEIKHNEYDRRLKDVMPYLTPSTRLLEIGAGEGKFLQRVKPYVAEAHAVELAPVHASSLREQGFHVIDKDLAGIEPATQYDVVCMFAVLEHIPHVVGYMQMLKKWLHKDSVVIIETPNRMEPLVSFYDVPEYRNFFYREYHLYNFNEASLQALLAKAGFNSKTCPLQVASLTNHFHWLHTGTKQSSMNDMVNVVLPRPLLHSTTPSGQDFHALLDSLDDHYRKLLQEVGVGDILLGVASLGVSP